MAYSFYTSSSTIPIFNYAKAMEGDLRYLLKTDIDLLPNSIKKKDQEKLRDCLLNINKELSKNEINDLFNLAGEVKELEALHEAMTLLNFILSKSVFCSEKFREEFIKKKLGNYGLKLDVKYNNSKIGVIKTKLNQSLKLLHDTSDSVVNKDYKFDSERLFKNVKEVSQELGFNIDLLSDSIKDYLLHVEVLSDRAKNKKSHSHG